MCVGESKLDVVLVKQKNLKISTRRIGIGVVIMKKNCVNNRDEFKVSSLNSVHLICDFYFNFWFNMFKS